MNNPHTHNLEILLEDVDWLWSQGERNWEHLAMRLGYPSGSHIQDSVRRARQRREEKADG